MANLPNQKFSFTQVHTQLSYQELEGQDGLTLRVFRQVQDLPLELKVIQCLLVSH